MNSIPSRSAASFLMAEPHRPLACSILFADLVGASLLSDDEQVRNKQALNSCIAQALQDTPASARLALDAGDGVAICFALPAEAALRVALVLQHLLQDMARPLQARMGLHFGPVRVVPDVNDRPNVVGDGINVARRIMDFARPGQLLASDQFRIATGLDERAAAQTFRFLGPFADKHGRLHQVQAVHPASAAAPRSARRSCRCPASSARRGPSRAISWCNWKKCSANASAPFGQPVRRQLVAQGLDAEDLIEALAHEIAPRTSGYAPGLADSMNMLGAVLKKPYRKADLVAALATTSRAGLAPA
jgi:class 3 adenylate cyclase